MAGETTTVSGLPRLRVPVVLLLCAGLLGLWGMSLPGPRSVVCNRAAPN